MGERGRRREMFDKSFLMDFPGTALTLNFWGQIFPSKRR